MQGSSELVAAADIVCPPNKSAKYWAANGAARYLIQFGTKLAASLSPEAREERQALRKGAAKFRITPCANFKSTGQCPYGDRCHFYHTQVPRPVGTGPTAAECAAAGKPQNLKPIPATTRIMLLWEDQDEERREKGTVPRVLYAPASTVESKLEAAWRQHQSWDTPLPWQSNTLAKMLSTHPCFLVTLAADDKQFTLSLDVNQLVSQAAVMKSLGPSASFASGATFEQDSSRWVPRSPSTRSIAGSAASEQQAVPAWTEPSKATHKAKSSAGGGAGSLYDFGDAGAYTDDDVSSKPDQGFNAWTCAAAPNSPPRSVASNGNNVQGQQRQAGGLLAQQPEQPRLRPHGGRGLVGVVAAICTVYNGDTMEEKLKRNVALACVTSPQIVYNRYGYNTVLHYWAGVWTRQAHDLVLDLPTSDCAAGANSDTDLADEAEVGLGAEWARRIRKMCEEDDNFRILSSVALGPVAASRASGQQEYVLIRLAVRQVLDRAAALSARMGGKQGGLKFASHPPPQPAARWVSRLQAALKSQLLPDIIGLGQEELDWQVANPPTSTAGATPAASTGSLAGVGAAAGGRRGGSSGQVAACASSPLGSPKQDPFDHVSGPMFTSEEQAIALAAACACLWSGSAGLVSSSKLALALAITTAPAAIFDTYGGFTVGLGYAGKVVRDNARVMATAGAFAGEEPLKARQLVASDAFFEYLPHVGTDGAVRLRVPQLATVVLAAAGVTAALPGAGGKNRSGNKKGTSKVGSEFRPRCSAALTWPPLQELATIYTPALQEQARNVVLKLQGRLKAAASRTIALEDIQEELLVLATDPDTGAGLVAPTELGALVRFLDTLHGCVPGTNTRTGKGSSNNLANLAAASEVATQALKLAATGGFTVSAVGGLGSAVAPPGAAGPAATAAGAVRTGNARPPAAAGKPSAAAPFGGAASMAPSAVGNRSMRGPPGFRSTATAGVIDVNAFSCLRDDGNDQAANDDASSDQTDRSKSSQLQQQQQPQQPMLQQQNDGGVSKRVTSQPVGYAAAAAAAAAPTAATAAPAKQQQQASGAADQQSLQAYAQQQMEALRVAAEQMKLKQPSPAAASAAATAATAGPAAHPVVPPASAAASVIAAKPLPAGGSKAQAMLLQAGLMVRRKPEGGAAAVQQQPAAVVQQQAVSPSPPPPASTSPSPAPVQQQRTAVPQAAALPPVAAAQAPPLQQTPEQLLQQQWQQLQLQQALGLGLSAGVPPGPAASAETAAVQQALLVAALQQQHQAQQQQLLLAAAAAQYQQQQAVLMMLQQAQQQQQAMLPACPPMAAATSAAALQPAAVAAAITTPTAATTSMLAAMPIPVPVPMAGAPATSAAATADDGAGDDVDDLFELCLGGGA